MLLRKNLNTRIQTLMRLLVERLYGRASAIAKAIFRLAISVEIR